MGGVAYPLLISMQRVDGPLGLPKGLPMRFSLGKECWMLVHIYNFVNLY